MEAAPRADGAPEMTPAKTELPAVESPPLSPGTETPALAADTSAPTSEPIMVPMPASVSQTDATLSSTTYPRLVLRPRHKRYALLAALVTFAAALGAIVGALASGGFAAPPPAKPDVAVIEQNKAMQQSIAMLGEEITTLKASLEQVNKSAQTQIAKISERFDHAAAEVTGSIAATPLPVPRPVPRMAAAEPPPPARVPVVAGWTIRDIRNGYVFVEGHGDIFLVQPGAPLPGLGPVHSVKRQDGRWMVVTPRGIIVSMRDRRYFEEF